MPKLIYTVILQYSFVVQLPPTPRGGTVRTLVGRLQGGGGEVIYLPIAHGLCSDPEGLPKLHLLPRWSYIHCVEGCCAQKILEMNCPSHLLLDLL